MSELINVYINPFDCRHAEKHIWGLYNKHRGIREQYTMDKGRTLVFKCTQAGYKFIKSTLERLHVSYSTDKDATWHVFNLSEDSQETVHTSEKDALTALQVYHTVRCGCNDERFYIGYSSVGICDYAIKLDTKTYLYDKACEHDSGARFSEDNPWWQMYQDRFYRVANNS